MRILAVAFVCLIGSSWGFAKPSAEQPLGSWQLQDAALVSGGGAEVSSPSFDSKSWHAAVVPGTVLTSLVQDGVYPEPLYGENNRSIPESLCRTSYWYRTTVSVASAMRRPGRHLWLNFGGINYRAEIYANGKPLGNIDGAFVRGAFDLTALLGTSPDRLTVAVKILPPPHPGTFVEHTQAAGTGRNGGAIGADSPTFLATVGWDWIPGIRDRDMGLWQSVWLSSTGPVAVEDPYVEVSLPLPKKDTATLAIQTSLRNLTDKPVSGTIVCSIEGTGASVSLPVDVAPGEPQVFALPDVVLSHPRLWWPNGYGAQNLYTLRTKFVMGSTASDEQATGFGVRTIDYFEAGGKNMTLIVNGVPVFGKGGNWGMDEAMKRSPRERLEAQLRFHHDANCTMIRNWIGMATQEDFYAMCDKYGILVWDDFWLANPVDGPNPLDPDLFLANAKEKILRYRNHPSIAVWCGRNEGFPPPKINAGLAAMVAQLDRKRFYQPHSSSTNGVGGGGPYSYRKPSDYFTFRDAFHTEVGGPSIPTLEAIEAMMPERDWWPINDDWAEHDFCRGAQRGDQYPKVIADRFGPVTGLADFVRKAQLANYESYRAIFEGREAQLFDPATGVLLWMSNPAQPSFVWQLYSYDLEPTAAFYGTKKACEPIHVMMDPRDLKVSVINNTPNELKRLTVVASVFRDDGAKVFERSRELDATASRATLAFLVAPPNEKLSAVNFVELRLLNSRGGPLSDNFYWIAQPNVDDFTAMKAMKTVTLRVAATREVRTAGRLRVSVTLRNPSSGIALMTHVQLRRAGSQKRVLPAFYSDNYVTLLPGETRKIEIEAAAADLNGEDPEVALDGWNVRASQEGGSVRVITNAAALPASL